MNDYIPERASSVRYASISDAITVIEELGAGCFMAKTDIKSALGIIPIHPSDFLLLGMKCDNYQRTPHLQQLFFNTHCSHVYCYSLRVVITEINTNRTNINKAKIAETKSVKETNLHL